MISREQALHIVSEHEQSLRELGIESLSLFGSVARNEATDRSDVDCLIEFNRSVGLFHFMRVKEFLEKLFGCSVDLFTRDGIRPELRDLVLQDLIHAL